MCLVIYCIVPMINLKLYTSNRLEILAEQLATVLSTPLASPMEPEIIVVQSQGMERWVSMELARHFGICANTKFPFPNTFIHDMIQQVIPDSPDESLFDPQFMTWKIMKLLPVFIDQPGFESLNHYLGKSRFDLKYYQLSERIADIFDQYVLYRRELIFRWEQGKEDHWQAMLWRELVRGDEKTHRAALAKKFIRLLQDPAKGIDYFPQRISVFGISALPLFHIQILAAISRFTEVNFFLMNPCQDYWLDDLSDREIKRATVTYREQNIPEEELHLEKGNILLVSMGTLGRDFLAMIYDFEVEELSDFKEPGDVRLLLHIQSEILNRREKNESSTKIAIAESDFSIQLHSCHSPMREIETLQNQLLKMFEQNPGLLPRDVLVMAPDIEIYAPYIQAVFDLPFNDPRRIPFSITDRNVRKESQVIETFLAILDLWDSRFSAAQVMTILESPAVSSKFNFSKADLDLVRTWISATRIRWGIDENYRQARGLPGTSENSWRAGLDRLLMGYALPGQHEEMFADILPYNHIEGSQTIVLGNVLEFTDRLFTTVESIGKSRTLEGWLKFLQGLINLFFEPDEETQKELIIIWRALSDLVDIQQKTGFVEKIDIQVIKNYLTNRFEKEGHGFGFMTGGVTFCAMLPMRSIPFKVICLIGMNDTAYPRQEKSLGFNLITKYPQPGDRSRRKDDRYLFLEALLSARETLYISHVGQSIQDNSLIPPSVLVSELLDYIETGFEIPGKNILNHIIVKHRLQAFSPEYFKENQNLVSYSKENYEAARRLIESRQSPISFITRGLSAPDETWKEISIADLCNFFLNPSKYLLNKCLGIHLEEDVSILDESESFQIENLDKYMLEQNLVEKKLLGHELTEFYKATKASGLLPHGTVGDCVYEDMSRGIESFVQYTQQYIQAKPLKPINVDLKIDAFKLKGRIDGIYPENLLRYRYAKIKATDRLRIWIYHLILNSIALDNYPDTSLLVGLNPDSQDSQWAAWQYSSLEDGQHILARLLGIYWQGLVTPVHFFPETSWEYANRVLEKNKSHEDALKYARNVWTGSDYNRGEREDLYYQLCFSNDDPINEKFSDMAIEIFRPLIESQTKIP